MARGHFYPLPPPFIGGRQPYAPPLGQPQSGPVADAPPRITRGQFDAIVRAEFYPPPPTFIGGTQPYGPRLGIPQSGPVASDPPRRSDVNLHLVVRSWVPPYRAPPTPVEIAPLIIPDQTTGTGVPPPSRQWQDTVNQMFKAQPFTLIYLPSIAPILAIPPTIDNPPPSTNARLMSVLRQWDPVPNRVPPLKGVGQFSVAVLPDNPPPSSNVNQIIARTQWEPRKWWPLPANIIKIPPNGPVPDLPPASSYVTLNTIVNAWKAPPPRPVFKNQVSTQSAPPPIGSDGEVLAHLPAHLRAVKRAIRYAHGRRNDRN